MHGVLFKILIMLLLGTLVRVGVAEEAKISVEPVEKLSSAELQELVAPVALYPDDLIAIVLPSSTYPLQIVAASRYREAVAENDGADQKHEPDEEWDESIVALLNYPEALALLNEDLDWTWRLGEAVTLQQEDVLAAISEFRRLAAAAGNLSSDEYQEVATDDEHVTIRSRDPEVIYVPYYDPDSVTVNQIKRVYHYYPDPYPVYYYPYAYGHRFYDHHLFWGINSFFLLSWSNAHLYHHYHDHYRHPFYRRSYHHRHFRRTHRYHAPDAHERRARRYHRKRHHDHRDRRHRRDPVMPWRPHERYAGVRPRQRHHDLRRKRTNTESRRRRAEHTNEPKQRRAGLRDPRPRVTTTRPQHRSSVPRQRPQRSSVHRETPVQRRMERRAEIANKQRQRRANRNDAQRNKTQRPVMEKPQRPRVKRQANIDRQPRVNRQSRPARQPRAERQPRIARQPRAERQPRVARQPRAERQPRIARQPRAERQPRVSQKPRRAAQHRRSEPRKRAGGRPGLRSHDRAQAAR